MKDMDFRMNPGDEERFLVKFREAESKEEERGANVRIQRRLEPRKIPFLRMIVLPVAACFVIFMAVTVFQKGMADEARLDDVYLDYQAAVNNLHVEIVNSVSGDLRREAESVIRNITFEPVSFVEQLPREMSGNQKVMICKKYYERKIKGLEEYKKRILDFN